MADSPLACMARIGYALNAFQRLDPPNGNHGSEIEFRAAWKELTNALQQAQEVLEPPSAGNGLAYLTWRFVVTQYERIKALLKEPGMTFERLVQENSELRSAFGLPVPSAVQYFSRADLDKINSAPSLLGGGQSALDRLRALGKEWQETFADAPPEPPQSGLIRQELRNAWAPWQRKQMRYAREAGTLVLEATDLYKIRQELYQDDEFVKSLVWLLSYEDPARAVLHTLNYQHTGKEVLALSDWLEGTSVLNQSPPRGAIRELLTDLSQISSLQQRIEQLDPLGSKGLNRALQQGTQEAAQAVRAGSLRQERDQLKDKVQRDYEGIDRLQAYCDAHGGEWSPAWLRQQRGLLCEQLDVAPTEIDAMTVVEFHKALQDMATPQSSFQAEERQQSNSYPETAEQRAKACLDAFAAASNDERAQNIELLAVIGQGDSNPKLPDMPGGRGGSLKAIGIVNLRDQERERQLGLCLYSRGCHELAIDDWLVAARQSGIALHADDWLSRVFGNDCLKGGGDMVEVWAGTVVAMLWNVDNWKSPTEHSYVFTFPAFTAAIETWRRVLDVKKIRPLEDEDRPRNLEERELDGPNSKISNLQPAVQKAWASWLLAKRNLLPDCTDQQAYDWLKEQPDGLFIGDLFGYEMPCFSTWQRQLRTARKNLGEQKNKPRVGRPHGGSVVKAAEL